MLVFRIKGAFPSGLSKQSFTMDIIGQDEASAKEQLYSLIGSRHRANRRSIIVDSIEKIDPSKSSDPVVLHHFGIDRTSQEEE